ncbi:FUSC family protein [Branchiibius cervicis]|uniref:FUSC family protein n=1 Tax=Branchiibius cervicis TaxID=908252 RepID=A0ABW2ANK4_9MICO
MTFGVVLALLLAIETYAAIAWIPGTNVWWVVLTTLVVLSPDQKHSMSRSVERAGGTVLGAIVATAVISLLGRGTTLTLVGVVAALLTAMAYVTARYWIFAALLTFALVVLTVPADRVVHSSADRIGYTLIAAAVALVVSAALKRLIVRYPHLP